MRCLRQSFPMKGKFSPVIPPFFKFANLDITTFSPSNQQEFLRRSESQRRLYPFPQRPITHIRLCLGRQVTCVSTSSKGLCALWGSSEKAGFYICIYLLSFVACYMSKTKWFTYRRSTRTGSFFFDKRRNM